MIKNVEKLRDDSIKNFKNLKIHDGIESAISIFRLINKFLEDKAPWKSIKENKDLASTTIYLSAESLRIGTILLYPIIPQKSQFVLNALRSDPFDNIKFGILEKNLKIDIIKNIFPRIED